MIITWIAAISLGALILGLLLAPVFDVRLNRNVVNPLLVAGLFLAVGLALANAASYFRPMTDPHEILGVLSGIFAAFNRSGIRQNSERSGHHVGIPANSATARFLRDMHTNSSFAFVSSGSIVGK
jgi:hypothetical protein